MLYWQWVVLMSAEGADLHTSPAWPVESTSLSWHSWASRLLFGLKWIHFIITKINVFVHLKCEPAHTCPLPRTKLLKETKSNYALLTVLLVQFTFTRRSQEYELPVYKNLNRDKEKQTVVVAPRELGTGGQVGLCVDTELKHFSLLLHCSGERESVEWPDDLGYEEVSETLCTKELWIWQFVCTAESPGLSEWVSRHQRHARRPKIICLSSHTLILWHGLQTCLKMSYKNKA